MFESISNKYKELLFWTFFTISVNSVLKVIQPWLNELVWYSYIFKYISNILVFGFTLLIITILGSVLKNRPSESLTLYAYTMILSFYHFLIQLTTEVKFYSHENEVIKQVLLSFDNYLVLMLFSIVIVCILFFIGNILW